MNIYSNKDFPFRNVIKKKGNKNEIWACFHFAMEDNVSTLASRHWE